MNKVILLYGMPAAGKFTMAKRLAAEGNSFLIDNHYFHDFIKPFIDTYNDTYFDHISKIKSEFIKMLAAFYPRNSPIQYIFTEVIVSPERDLKFISELNQLAVDIGGGFFPIGLYSNLDALKSRCVSEERIKRDKLHDPDQYAAIFGNDHDFRPLEFSHPNRLVIDSSLLTEDETFQEIKEHLNQNAER